jgi:hypothetical protein
LVQTKSSAVLADVSVDGLLEVGDGLETPRRIAPAGDDGEEAVDGIDPGADAGLEWNAQRG